MAKHKPKLKLAQIKKDNAKFLKYRDIELNDGKVIEVLDEFSETTVRTILEDFAVFGEALENLSEQFKFLFLQFLIVKHTTTFGEQLSEDYDNLEQEMVMFLNLHYMDDLMNEKGYIVQCQKVYDKSVEVMNTFNKLIEVSAQALVEAKELRDELS